MWIQPRERRVDLLICCQRSSLHPAVRSNCLRSGMAQRIFWCHGAHLNSCSALILILFRHIFHVILSAAADQMRQIWPFVAVVPAMQRDRYLQCGKHARHWRSRDVRISVCFFSQERKQDLSEQRLSVNSILVPNGWSSENLLTTAWRQRQRELSPSRSLSRARHSTPVTLKTESAQWNSSMIS